MSMTRIEYVDVECDGCGFAVPVGETQTVTPDAAGDFLTGSESLEETAAITLAQFGWTHQRTMLGYDDYCPRCTKRRGNK